MDTFTSLLGGITIFAILGNLAHNMGIKDISKVVKSGSGLAFISYPDAISKIDWVPQVQKGRRREIKFLINSVQLFSVLFFFMLFVLGIGSLVALVNAVITVLWDQFPKIKYWQVALSVCCLGYFTGLIYITPVNYFYSAPVRTFNCPLIIYRVANGC